MEIRGQESQQWGNVVNAATLSQVQERDEWRIIANEDTANEFDQIATLLLNVNSILEMMIIAEDYPRESITMDIPAGVADFIEFNDLYEKWQNTRKRTSSIVGDITRNQFYFRIVGMGPRALPFIFSHLEDETKKGEPDHWFPALSAITGADPVPLSERGRIRQMAISWLEWGRREGYLYAEGVGKGVSESR
jgi:hypothetical protein